MRYFKLTASNIFAFCLAAAALAAGVYYAANGRMAPAGYALITIALLLLLPTALDRLFGIIMPPAMLALFCTFVFCAELLGSAARFYDSIPHFDDILHATSGLVFSLFSGAMIDRLDGGKPSFAFRMFYAFCFVAAAGVIWEIFEFSADMLLGTNMQVYTQMPTYLDTGVVDTMSDLIANQFGSLLFIPLALAVDSRPGLADKLYPYAAFERD